MRKFLLALAACVALAVPSLASAQAVPITDIAARSRLALGVSRVFDNDLAFEKDEVSLFYSFGLTKHLNLAANANFAFNVKEDIVISNDERMQYKIGIRYGLGVK